MKKTVKTNSYDMSDLQREKFLSAVYSLRELVEQGIDRDSLIEEVEEEID